MKELILISLFFLFAFQNSYSQKTGGGELNPGIYANQKSLENFQNLRFGLSIHWGPNVVAGKEISWSRGKETPVAEYDNFYKQFNPTKFNADEWVKMIQDFGMKYVIITSKHHDGFSMWHSEYSDYDVEATPFKRDILKELSEACLRKGIVFGTYYSTLDWYHPDYLPHGKGGPGELFRKYSDTPNQNRYWIYMKNQLRELLTIYHSEIIQFDGDWDPTWTHEIGSDMYLYIRKINDEVLVNSRTDKGRQPPPPYNKKDPWRADIFAGDFEERERFTESAEATQDESKMMNKSVYPWQAWVTVDKSQWSWKPNATFHSSREIVIDLLKTVGGGGNYLINIGPRPDGTFEPTIVATMKEVGKWVKAHGDAIYETRAGDFSQEGKYTSTQKGKTTNLFIFDDSVEEVTLKSSNKLLNIKNEKGQSVAFQQINEKITMKLDKNNGGFLRFYKLTF